MPVNPPARINKLLNLDYLEKDKIWLTKQNTLKKLIGILGMLLPILLYLFLLLDGKIVSPLASISHYYYTRASGVFVSIISLLGFFLLIYKGKAPIDFYISSLAGLFALCLVLFPTTNISDICCDAQKPFSVTRLNISVFRSTFHLISSGVFLTCLAILSIFFFTKSNMPIGKRSPLKPLRNKIYRTCGITMIVALIIIAFRFANIIPANFYDKNHLTFWMESIAVESFGISWLIKGKQFFND